MRQRRADPDDSILSALIAAREEEGDKLSPGEVVSTALLLLVAGYETTVNLIANAVVALLSDPRSYHGCATTRPPYRAAIEEMLRYDGPVQLTSRIATADPRPSAA